MKRVVVDGAGGFVGRHVALTLAELGYPVRATDREGTSMPVHPRIEAVHGDLARMDLGALLAGAPLVVHVAGLFDLAAPERELRAANVELPLRVAEAALAAGVDRFVHVSSVTVYGRPARMPADESTPARPESAYERTKHEGEQALLTLARDRKLPLVVLRPSGIYGPHGRYGTAVLAASMALAAATGRGHRSLRPTARMTHVHVGDVARACAAVLDPERCSEDRVVGRAFNVADETPVAWSELCASMEGWMGLPTLRPLRLTPFVARGLSLMGRIAPARLARTNESIERRWSELVRAEGLVPALRPRIDAHAYDYFFSDHVYDTTALRSLGWRAEHRSVITGMHSTLDWYVRERWLPRVGEWR